MNTTLGTVVASDSDEDENGNILFEIITGDTDLFSLVITRSGEEMYSAEIINNQVCQW